MSYGGTAQNQRGIALLGIMVLMLVLSLLGATLLNLAGQEAISVGAGKEAAVAQQLADAAGDLVVGWFHRPSTSPRAIATLLAKRYQTSEGWPSFFDQSGHSQFVGSFDRPDLQLDSRNSSDDLLLNDATAGLFRSLRGVGRVLQLKLYAPSRLGLLCTIDATVETDHPVPARQSMTVQLSALDLPALRSGVQVGQGLGLSGSGEESIVWAHWGPAKVGGDLVVRRVDDIPIVRLTAPIDGQRYDQMAVREDRWAEIWVGGVVQIMQPPPGQTGEPSLPTNVHVQQVPIPGLPLDRWDYHLLKQVAVQHGSYYAVDQDGFLHPNGLVQPGEGLSPDEVFRSTSVGDQRGLIFIDTLDQSAPRTDNLGTVKLRAGYFEGLVVVQGHIQLQPGMSGQTVAMLSPPSGVSGGTSSRLPVQVSGIHLNGVLYAAGNITITGTARIVGSVTAGGTIAAAAAGASLEVWHNDDMSRGLFEGLPVVYRAPGTWMVRY